MTDISELHREVLKRLREYNREVEEGLVRAKDSSARKLVQDLKRTSPKDTGDYQKGWRIKKSGITNIVHNATDYQLTHLLEHGHVKRNSSDRVNPQVHIAPAEERAVRDYVEQVEKVIEQ